jgi:hypothetical protein
MIMNKNDEFRKAARDILTKDTIEKVYKNMERIAKTKGPAARRAKKLLEKYPLSSWYNWLK